MTSYDRIPYEGWSYAFTHPEVMAAVGRLHGLTPAPIEGCRVLEIGCAAGYNTIPMAFALPGAHFVGIDYAARQIDEGCALIERLQVPNVKLHRMDLMDLAAWDGRLGSFDYIIAHGVYSWVAAPVRDALLAICRDALTPDGLAYISYNTYPGWHMMEAMRRMMLYHTRNVEAPEERAAAARALMGFLVQATSNASHRLSSYPSAYEHLLTGYYHGILNMKDRSDSLFLHDELEEINEPCYFHEFLAHAGRFDLAYVADAEFSTGLSTALPEEVAAEMAALSGPDGEQGQYLDFVVNRTFRRSLLCRSDKQPSQAIDLHVLDSLYFSAQARGLLAADSDPENAAVEFVAGDGAKLVSDHPVTIVAMTHLRRIWPRRAALDELLDAAYAQLIETNPHLDETLSAALARSDAQRRGEDRALLAGNLLRAYCTSSELISFHTGPGVYTAELSERPTASAWARWEAGKRTTVTDLRLRRVVLPPRCRYLLPLLDGSRTVADLRRAIVEDESEAAGVWDRGAEPSEGASWEAGGGPAGEQLDAQLAEALDQIAGNGFLVA